MTRPMLRLHGSTSERPWGTGSASPHHTVDRPRCCVRSDPEAGGSRDLSQSELYAVRRLYSLTAEALRTIGTLRSRFQSQHPTQRSSLKGRGDRVIRYPCGSPSFPNLYSLSHPFPGVQSHLAEVDAERQSSLLS